MNLLPKSLTVLILILLFNSCEKNEPTADNNIYWKVNDASKSAKPDADWIVPENSFLLEATSGKDYISLFIDSNFHEGTFPLNNPFNGALIEYKIGNGKDYYSDNGTLVITRTDDKHVEGTFSFTVDSGSAKKVITEGSFNAKLHYLNFSDTSDYSSDSLYNVMKTKRLSLHNSQLNFRH